VPSTSNVTEATQAAQTELDIPSDIEQEQRETVDQNEFAEFLEELRSPVFQYLFGLQFDTDQQGKQYIKFPLRHQWTVAVPKEKLNAIVRIEGGRPATQALHQPSTLPGNKQCR
jgi:hypothetical protein